MIPNTSDQMEPDGALRTDVQVFDLKVFTIFLSFY